MADSERQAIFYRSANGDYRIKVDAPGIAAVSAAVDPATFIQQIADEAGLKVTIEPA